MKIQTNAGEVELTAEMVVRGMVFQWSDGAVTTAIETECSTTGRLDHAAVWRSRGPDPKSSATIRSLLGCDPTIATRADCERYGVHGDAAAHGFARLRGGGALDLRREEIAPEGCVYTHQDGGNRYTTGARVAFTNKMRFVGLDARYARRDHVEWLCCGAERAGGMVTNAITGEPIEVPPRRCTLAIGDHDEHEDLATGAKWSAAGEMPAPPGGWKTAEQIDREVAERGRRNREAPLVALVNACPPDLDPDGWRAAVLGYAEGHKTALSEAEHEADLKIIRGGIRDGGLAALAYQRAITPHRAPPPERKRGGRDVRVVLDDGRDE